MVRVPLPRNEPVRSYAPGSAERAALEARLAAIAKERVTAPLRIGGPGGPGGPGGECRMTRLRARPSASR